MSITLSIPGSKSISNRALILCALSNQTIIIKNLAACDDTAYMIQALKKLKVKISKLSKSTIKIQGTSGKFKPQKKLINIYTGNAGTTTRFITALSTLTGNNIQINGDKRMRERPIKQLTDALNKLGANIKTNKGYLPIKIQPTPLLGGKVKLPGNISSQFISALLMITPFAKSETTIDIEQNLCSKPYVNMTIEMLKQFGIKVMNKNFKQFRINPIKNQKSPEQYVIEPDASSASYIGGYSALHSEKTITIKNLKKKSLQGDIKFLQYLQKMGCRVTESKQGIKIKAPKTLKPLKKTDMNETPDLVMTFAVLAMFTKARTIITNIENLRIKECDRLKALKNEIQKFNIKVKTTASSIEIQGNPDLLKNPPKNKITIQTYNDHRIAMCFGMIQSLFPNLTIKNPNCVSKSYSTFWSHIKKLKNNK
jgi:3-phosphoshikimate 1-carboxyvinyltransferase